MAERFDYQDPTLDPQRRAGDLLSRMTLDEKLAQLAGVWASELLDDGAFDPGRAREVLAHGAGQVTRLGATTVMPPAAIAEVINAIQSHLIEHTRLGIPTVVHEESCAGLVARGATQFPQAIGLASTFEPALVQQMAEVIRTQMRAIGTLQTLAPVLDIARDPRWGRCEETFGEDPHLASRMGVAYVRGVQGDDLSKGVVATGKHFLGYGAPEGGRNWGVCMLPPRELRERYLPPFAAAIREAGLASMMNGYQEIDGVPCGASQALLTGLLREELGFDGVVVADYFTVSCLQSFHHIAGDQSEAAARALEAGLDVELPARDCYGAPLAEAVRNGRVPIETVDEAVRRVLRQKFQLGLFERSLVDAGRVPEVFDTPPQRALARKLAQQSMVLLKNDGVLPLADKGQRIAVLGPNADSIRNLQGDYHYPTHSELTFGPTVEPGHPRMGNYDAALAPGFAGKPADLLQHFTPHVSVLEGIRAAAPDGCTVTHARGCGLREGEAEDIDGAVAVARDSDVAVLVLGGRSGVLPDCTSGEAVDATDLRLTGGQQRLLAAVAATGTPTVVVLVGGRIFALTEAEPHAAALLEAWLPGEEGGHAVADVLFGRVNPAGRLPVTMPRAVGQVPLYYNHKPSGAVSMFHGNYSDCAVTPLYAFGHGLSYTRFDYSDLRLSASALTATDTLQVTVHVRNTGERDGEEVVQLYACDPVASITRPVRELKAFDRIALAAGEGRDVTLRLPISEMALLDANMRSVVEAGELQLMVGAASDDIRLQASVTIV